ncbi:CHAP domain-containing protein [Staphylococcus aureus]
MEYKKILIRLLIAFAVLFSADFTYQSVEQTHQSHAAVNYYSTWWAFKRRAQVGKPVSNRWGNAKNWYYNARKSKYATGRTPRKFAVMQSTAGYYGHVAVVEQVYKNGSIKVSEYNFYRPLKYNTRVLSKKAARNFNYIY